MSAEQVTGATSLSRSQRRRQNPAHESPRTTRAFSGFPLLRNPLPFIETLFREHGDMASARFLNFPVYIVAHPEEASNTYFRKTIATTPSPRITTFSRDCWDRAWSRARVRCGSSRGD